VGSGAISDAEMDQIRRTGRFEVGGATEGKYFWERRGDAKWFATQYGAPHVVCARYEAVAMPTFYRWAYLDGRGAARFADEEQMNYLLLEIKEVI
jgi:hypothetical protein